MIVVDRSESRCRWIVPGLLLAALGPLGLGVSLVRADDPHVRADGLRKGVRNLFFWFLTPFLRPLISAFWFLTPYLRLTSYLRDPLSPPFGS